MSDHAKNRTLTVETEFYRYQFACGCEFLTRAEFCHIQEREDITCMFHKIARYSLWTLDENGYWRALMASDGGLLIILDPIPVSHGPHPDDAYFPAGPHLRRLEREASETL